MYLLYKNFITETNIRYRYIKTKLVEYFIFKSVITKQVFVDKNKIIYKIVFINDSRDQYSIITLYPYQPSKHDIKKK